MELAGCIALVTGAGGGLGRAIVTELCAADAAKVYAACRTVDGIAGTGFHDKRVVPLIVDVMIADQIADARHRCGDVNLLVNNAGVNARDLAIGPSDVDAARHEIEVNYLGALAMARAFAPAIIENGGGAVVNVLSILSRVNYPAMATYCASKAATGSLTQALRAQLEPAGVRVTAFMPSAIDTTMSDGLEIPKISREEAAAALLQALRDDIDDVYPDDLAHTLARGLAADHKAVEAQLAELVR